MEKKKFVVNMVFTGYVPVEVEAMDEEEAMSIAAGGGIDTADGRLVITDFYPQID